MKTHFQTGSIELAHGPIPPLTFDLSFNPVWAWLEIDSTAAHCGGTEADAVAYQLGNHSLTLTGTINSESATVKWLVIG